MEGRYEAMDRWLAEVGYDPLEVAKLPFQPEVGREAASLKSHLSHLRAIQKPDRLRAFDEKHGSVDHSVGTVVSDSAEEKHAQKVSPLFGEKKNLTREQQEPESQEEWSTRGIKTEERKPNQAVGDHNKRRVAPPAETIETPTCSVPRSVKRGPPCPKRSPKKVDELLLSGIQGNAGRRKPRVRENNGSPFLSNAAYELLRELPSAQFFGPDGKRCSHPFSFRRRGYLDLFSGAAGVAKALAKKYRVWVLSFDWEHCSSENLLDEGIRKKIVAMLNEGCFLGAGLAPECGSFSRAVTPAVRDRVYPMGKPDISPAMQLKVDRGNAHAEFSLTVVQLCLKLGLSYWLENPDGSFLWLQPKWVASRLALMENAYRFDMCRYLTVWRKRTRIATNTSLAGLRELCTGDHTHVVLRGRSSFHRDNWTHVAQVYPQRLCHRIAAAVAEFSHLQPVGQLRRKLDISGCAKSAPRIGEAKHPRPRTRPLISRDPDDLTGTLLVEPVTFRLQHRVWSEFDAWLQKTLSSEAVHQIFRSPGLVVLILERYGVELFSKGAAMYVYRHLLVVAQQRMPLIKPYMAPAWQVLTRWESLQPLVHRVPLPEVIFRAALVIALMWKWHRWAGTLTVAFEGLGRIGEALNARRRDLVLPSDNFDDEHKVAYLKISKPKSRRRGRGRIQHLRIDSAPAVEFLEKVFSQVHPVCKLFPLSPSAFRFRWERIMDALLIPKNLRPTPASVRGGGAIMAYRRGEPIANILWRMRLLNQQTLESYLQETAADSLLAKLPDPSRERIRATAKVFSFALLSSNT